jgi:hypothetical protein
MRRVGAVGAKNKRSLQPSFIDCGLKPSQGGN